MSRKQQTKLRLKDTGVIAAFVGAICIMILAACYVAGRLTSERVYRAKWQDYNDCGLV